MSFPWRTLRVTDTIFEHHLDEQLGLERGPNGEPSATDFLVMELPAIVERFATDFDGLPEIVSGLSAAQLLIATGVLAHGIAHSSEMPTRRVGPGGSPIDDLGDTNLRSGKNRARQVEGNGRLRSSCLIEVVGIAPFDGPTGQLR